MTSFGDNLRKLRKERKLSMDALAEKAGTSKQVLSRYENGERVPKIFVISPIGILQFAANFIYYSIVFPKIIACL